MRLLILLYTLSVAQNNAFQICLSVSLMLDLHLKLGKNQTLRSRGTILGRPRVNGTMTELRVQVRIQLLTHSLPRRIRPPFARKRLILCKITIKIENTAIIRNSCLNIRSVSLIFAESVSRKQNIPSVSPALKCYSYLLCVVLIWFYIVLRHLQT